MEDKVIVRWADCDADECAPTERGSVPPPSDEELAETREVRAIREAP